MSVTDDQIKSRGKEQYTDHSLQGKKEGNASQRVCLSRRVFTLIIQPRVLGYSHLPLYPSVHILHTSLHSGGRLFYISCLSIQLPLPFHVVACSCLSHTISYHLAYHYQSKSSILLSIHSTYRSGTDTFLSYYITSPSHQS
jgi:hypothetical protein